MKIKQVEELVGITRKNIRFYEEQGLLNVERAENGYREYHTADIARLQEIKLFRKMDISIEEMRALFEKRKSLQFCLEQHLGELERRCSGEMALAFSLYPVTMDDLFRVADAGEIMPPKSTWFEPKLRSGLFVHTIEQ